VGPLSVGLALAAGLGTLRLYSAASRRAAIAQLGRFTHLPALGTYQEARPRAGGGATRARHAVLLIHGYSASPGTFDTVVAELERRGIPYYAPRLTGFGQDDLALLAHTRAHDWRRDVQEAYDLLAAWADEVSVVGMSFGALLALELAGRVPVRHLVLASPYFEPVAAAEKRLRRAFGSRLLAGTLAALLPVYTKPRRAGRASSVDVLDAEAACTIFHYPALPLASLVEVARFAATARLTQAQARTVTVISGGRDETTDPAAFLAHLDRHGIAHEARCFAASDHGVLEDGDRHEVATYLVDRLAG
jgi:carboxylesterase